MASSFAVHGAVVLGVVLFASCVNRVVYPIGTGSHVPLTDKEWQEGLSGKRFRFVVWGNHPAMVSTIMGFLQEGGHTVVERARLQEVFAEQKIRLTHTPDDEADVLRVGRLVGADLVIFAEASVAPESRSGAYVGPYGGGARSFNVYHVSVAVRAVRIESGEVRWSGAGHFSEPINNPDQAVISLTTLAIGKAICPVERGFEWTDPGNLVEGGCKKKE